MPSPANLSLPPEKQLLLCCARTRVDSSTAATIKRLATQNLDWKYLLAMGEEHGLIPLLCSQLNAYCSSDVPTEVMERLRKQFRDTARRNLFLTSELFRIVDSLKAQGICAIPYKGPVLAEQAYGNLAFRQFVDLDVIIPQRDVARALPVVCSEGYRAAASIGNVSGDLGSRIPGEYLFTRENGGTALELHTEQTMRYFPKPLDFEALGARLEPISICGRSIRALSAEDALPMLCVHGSKHFWERLCWIADVAELAQSPRGVNWDVAIEWAGRLGAERMLDLGLFLAAELLGLELPSSEIRRRIQARGTVERIASTVREGLYRDDGREFGVLRRLFFRIQMRGGFLAGIRYVLRLATAPTEEDWSEMRLEGPLRPLYAVFRPFRLLRKYGIGFE